MVGLSVVLESQKDSIINKTTIITMLSTTSMNQHQPSPPSSSSSPNFQASCTFLDHCFLCNKRLLPGKDIYMYKGDRAFCSVDCRCKHILTDEEEAIKNENCHHHHRKEGGAKATNQARGVA